MPVIKTDFAGLDLCDLVAGFAGAFIPIFLSRINIDPAAASGVFLTTLTDILGFSTFLALAYFFLI